MATDEIRRWGEEDEKQKRISMNWYVAKLIFRILCEQGLHKSQFDEQLWLFQADCDEDAFEKARAKGFLEEVSFQGCETGRVSWQFLDVVDINRIGVISDGLNLSSRTDETEDPIGYMISIARRAESIQQQAVFSGVNHY